MLGVKKIVINFTRIVIRNFDIFDEGEECTIFISIVTI